MLWKMKSPIWSRSRRHTSCKAFCCLCSTLKWDACPHGDFKYCILRERQKKKKHLITTSCYVPDLLLLVLYIYMRINVSTPRLKMLHTLKIQLAALTLTTSRCMRGVLLPKVHTLKTHRSCPRDFKRCMLQNEAGPPNCTLGERPNAAYFET